MGILFFTKLIENTMSDTHTYDFEQDFDDAVLEDGKLSQAQIDELYAELDEAGRNLRTIRDFIRFASVSCVSMKWWWLKGRPMSLLKVLPLYCIL